MMPAGGYNPPLKRGWVLNQPKQSTQTSPITEWVLQEGPFLNSGSAFVVVAAAAFVTRASGSGTAAVVSSRCS